MPPQCLGTIDRFRNRLESEKPGRILTRGLAIAPLDDTGAVGSIAVATRFFKHFGLFVEYKLTHSDLEVGLGTDVRVVEENTHHLIGGVPIPLLSFSAGD